MVFAGRDLSFKWDMPTGVVALIAAVLCMVPLAGFLLAWHQLVDLRAFTLFATLPALVGLGICEYVLVQKSPLLFNRFATGLVGGLLGTLVLDLVRLPAAYLALVAPDWVPMIGQYLVGETVGIAPSVRAVVLGLGYHYLLIGALLGAAYSLVVGQGRWYWAAAASLVVGIAFMFMPQVQLLTVATGFDLTSANMLWAAAFLAGGVTLGLAVQRLGRTTTNALYVVFMREEPVETPELATSGS